MKCIFSNKKNKCTLAGYVNGTCPENCDDAEYEVDVTGQVHEYLKEQDEH